MRWNASRALGRLLDRLVLVLGLLAATAVAPTARADDPPPPPLIQADQAADHVGEKVTVELKVAASKNGKHRQCYYLDSTDDYRDPKNFTAIIRYEHLEAFRAVGISDPSAHYFGKTIRVTGTVIEQEDQVRIQLTAPSQIELVPPPTRP